RAAAQDRLGEARRLRRRQEYSAQENRETRKGTKAPAKRLEAEERRNALRRRTQSLGTDLRERAGRRAHHQLGTGFVPGMPPAHRQVQADRAISGAALRGRKRAETG